MIIFDSKNTVAYNTENETFRIIDRDYSSLFLKGFDPLKNLNLYLKQGENELQSYVEFDLEFKGKVNIEGLSVAYNKEKKKFLEEYNKKVDLKEKMVMDKFNERRKGGIVREKNLNDDTYYRKETFLDKSKLRFLPPVELILRNLMKYVYHYPLNHLYFKSVTRDYFEGRFLPTNESDRKYAAIQILREMYKDNILTQEQKVRMIGLFCCNNPGVAFFDVEKFDEDKPYRKLQYLRQGLYSSEGEGGEMVILTELIMQEYSKALNKYLVQRSYNPFNDEARSAIAACNNDNDLEQLSPTLYKLAKTKQIPTKNIDYTFDEMKKKLISFFNKEMYLVNEKNNYWNFKEKFKNYVFFDKTEDLSPIMMYRKYLKVVGSFYGVGEKAFDYILRGEEDYKVQIDKERSIQVLPGQSNFDINTINYFLNYVKMYYLISDYIPNFENLNLKEFYEKCKENIFNENDLKKLKLEKDKEKINFFDISKNNESIIKL